MVFAYVWCMVMGDPSRFFWLLFFLNLLCPKPFGNILMVSSLFKRLKRRLKEPLNLSLQPWNLGLSLHTLLTALIEQTPELLPGAQANFCNPSRPLTRLKADIHLLWLSYSCCRLDLALSGWFLKADTWRACVDAVCPWMALCQAYIERCTILTTWRPPQQRAPPKISHIVLKGMITQRKSKICMCLRSPCMAFGGDTLHRERRRLSCFQLKISFLNWHSEAKSSCSPAIRWHGLPFSHD